VADEGVGVRRLDQPHACRGDPDPDVGRLFYQIPLVIQNLIGAIRTQTWAAYFIKYRWLYRI